MNSRVGVDEVTRYDVFDLDQVVASVRNHKYVLKKPTFILIVNLVFSTRLSSKLGGKTVNGFGVRSNIQKKVSLTELGARHLVICSNTAHLRCSGQPQVARYQ